MLPLARRGALAVVFVPVCLRSDTPAFERSGASASARGAEREKGMGFCEALER